MGARTALVERYGFLGGAASASNVLTYCGFWTRADPCARAVAGIGAEVLAALAALGNFAGPVRMASTRVVVALIDPEAVKLVFDRFAAAAGVDVFLHSLAVAAERDGDAIAHVTAHDHGGDRKIAASAFVDASGEADLAFLAGAPTRYGDETGFAQNGTMALRFGGIDPDADVSRDRWADAVRAAKRRGIGPLSKEHSLVTRLPCGDVLAFLADEEYDARDARSASAAERHGREQGWAYLEAIRSLPGHAGAYLAASGPAIGTRESRHVAARYRLTASDVEGGASFPDAIALGAWPMEFHGGAGVPSEWRSIAQDGAYEIPLRTLESAGVRNLWSAGRTIDADRYAFASARVMGTAFATGHAAGIAAALSAGGDGAGAEEVRATLREQGAFIDRTMLEPERSFA
jgi:hypothetical protein